MKQTHWLLYESTHSDWFREITQLSNLNRAMSSMRLSLNKTQLRTNQNARRTGLLYKLDRSTAPNIEQFSRAEFQNKTLWTQSVLNLASRWWVGALFQTEDGKCGWFQTDGLSLLSIAPSAAASEHLDKNKRKTFNTEKKHKKSEDDLEQHCLFWN